MTKDLVALWATFEQNLVLVLGVILFAGAILGRAVEFLHLPQITGYIIAGLILGPHGIGLVDDRLVWPLHVLTIVALATIAFNIGSEFDRAKLRRTGVAVCTLAAAQLVGSFLLVLGAMLAIGLAWQYVLLLAALATSTAPVTTYTVIHSIGARGRAVDYVYGVLALNDASVIVIFGFVSSIVASTLIQDGSGPGPLAAVLPALANEGLSIAYGAASGIAVALALRFMQRDPRVNDVRMKISFIGIALVFVGVSLILGLSHLLAPLALGVTLANTVPRATMERLKELLRPFTDPLFLVFLVLAGAHLRANVLGHPMTTLIAGCYLVFRLAGKYAGITAAAALLELPKRMVRNLGLCFAPQGGLVIGMLLTFANLPAIAALPPDQGVQLHRMVSAVLIAVLISQLFGPAVIRYGLIRTASHHDRQ
jgi:Kef-type K+ transport system membrane component KefB